VNVTYQMEGHFESCLNANDLSITQQFDIRCIPLDPISQNTQISMSIIGTWLSSGRTRTDGQTDEDKDNGYSVHFKVTSWINRRIRTDAGLIRADGKKNLYKKKKTSANATRTCIDGKKKKF
jgi:hypothetical protein